MTVGCFVDCNGEKENISGSSVENTTEVSVPLTEAQWQAAWTLDTSKGICIELSMESAYCEMQYLVEGTETSTLRQKGNVYHTSIVSLILQRKTEQVCSVFLIQRIPAQFLLFPKP